jgi:DeoR/GlpR family transcriptional regulator of sugar metabolism
MLTEERHDIIRGRLMTRGRVLASELASQFGVSEDTVRRDLRELARAGICRRVYGGAIAPAPYAGPISLRKTQGAEAKARLAKAAVGLLSAGQTIFIDAGSTNIAIANAVPQDVALTIATNSIAVANALSDNPSIRLVMLGGVFDRERGACLGGDTVQAVRHLQADLFFLGACGLDSELGVTAFDPAEAEVKRVMAEYSTGLAVAATTDKLATVAPFRVAGPAAIRHLIVERDAPAPTLAEFANRGATVHLCD